MAAKRQLAAWISFGGAVCLVCIIAFVDVVTGYEINLSLFYLIPVALATWFTGWQSGMFFSIVSVVGMFLVDNFVTRDIPFPSHDLIPYWNTAIRLGYFMTITMTLATLKRAHDREKLHARQDTLTGVANSQTFLEVSRAEIERARRYRHPVSIAYMDCDNFKEVNDRFGHNKGDELLKVVATTLTERVRNTDAVARLGGDEFAILFPETPPQSATEVVQSLQTALLDRMRRDHWPVTFSIGVVTFIAPPASIEEALRLSDALMYVAKRSGKNMVKHQIV